jgi:hypothetical protein
MTELGLGDQAAPYRLRPGRGHPLHVRGRETDAFDPRATRRCSPIHAATCTNRSKTLCRNRSRVAQASRRSPIPAIPTCWRGVTPVASFPDQRGFQYDALRRPRSPRPEAVPVERAHHGHRLAPCLPGRGSRGSTDAAQHRRQGRSERMELASPATRLSCARRPRPTTDVVRPRLVITLQLTLIHHQQNR